MGQVLASIPVTIEQHWSLWRLSSHCVCVRVGVASSVGWLIWCYRVRARQPYAMKAGACILALNVLILLELGDFPPLWWSLDAHSLWHLGTAPIPFLWYRYALSSAVFTAQTYLVDKHGMSNNTCNIGNYFIAG